MQPDKAVPVSDMDTSNKTEHELAAACNSGGMLDKLAHIRKERGGYKAAITRKHHEIEELMCNTKDVRTVQSKLDEMERSWKAFRRIHEQYVELIKDDETEMTVADEYVRNVAISMERLKNEASMWLGNFTQHRETDEVDVGDSASQAGSAVSSSSMLVKAKAKKLVLLARARTLRMKQEFEVQQKLLERHQFELKQSVEKMLLDCEIEEAEIEEHAYAEGESVIRNSDKTVKSDLNPLASDFIGVSARQSNSALPSIHTGKSYTDGVSARQSNSALPSTHTGKSYTESQEHRDTDRILELQQKMMDIIQLPKMDLIVFDGDPIQYWKFIRSFESNIDRVEVSDSCKLNHLFQYCKGKALSVIECCAVMDPSEGYREAKNLLKTRFGNEYTIAKSWVDRVIQGSPVKSNDAVSLQSYADDLRSCVLTLSSMGRLGEIDNQIRMVKMVEKLPMYLQGRWRRTAVKMLKEENRYPDIQHFVRFVSTAAEEANDPVFGETARQASYARPTLPDRGTLKAQLSKQRSANFNVHVQAANSPSLGDARPGSGGQLICHKCSGKHPLLKCDDFRQLSPENRLEFVRQKRLCFNCFSSQHMANECPKPGRCSVGGCTGSHSKFLHVKPRPVSSQDDTEVKTAHNGHVYIESSAFPVDRATLPGVALPIVPVRVRAHGGQLYIDTYALLDSGSTNTFCSRELVDSLGLAGEHGCLSLTTLDKNSSKTDVVKVSLEITDARDKQVIQLPHVFSTQAFPELRGVRVMEGDLLRWPHLSDIDLPTVSNKKVCILIGQDVPVALTPLEIRRGRADEPYATWTIFGWTLNGPVRRESQPSHSNFIQCQSDENLNEQVEHFWKLEQVEDRQPMSVNDKHVIDLWDETTVLIDGHYEVRIPFKSQQPNLPNNYSVAESRLEGLQRKLHKDINLHQRYASEIGVLLEKGYAERVPDSEIMRNDGKVWYLPHHGVTNLNKPDKLRLVFDCSAVYNGTSLNKEVLQGPDLTNSLLGVLQRFRKDEIALMGDIEAMFHQVLVSPDDRDVLRFLWWKNDNLSMPPEVYRMKVHPFGGVLEPQLC